MIFFSKIFFGGEECIMITENDARPILILRGIEIDKLNKEWRGESFKPKVVNFVPKPFLRMKGHQKVPRKPLCICGAKMFPAKHQSGWACEREIEKLGVEKK